MDFRLFDLCWVKEIVAKTFLQEKHEEKKKQARLKDRGPRFRTYRHRNNRSIMKQRRMHSHTRR